MTNDDILRVAARLAEAAGLNTPVSVERLSGGRNNRVFLVILGDGQRVVMKSYHHDPRDERDRLGAEWAFLSHVWALGVHNVPRPLAARRDLHAGLFGFVDGRRPEAATPRLVEDAADFIIAVNVAPRRAAALGPGSEACFSLRDHLVTVARRVERLSFLDPTAPHAAAATALVAEGLRPAWTRVSARIEAAIAQRSIDAGAPIPVEIVSPSDFGFHNALVDGERTSFIDFEYAGRDDPAKLVCDFFCQPEIPAPLGEYGRFRDRVLRGLGFGPEEAWRCDLLLDAYRIKWACIILNEFLPVGAARRAFAESSDRSVRAGRQLARAERQLSLIAP